MVIKESLEKEKIWIQILISFGWELIISQARVVRFLIDKPFCWLTERVRIGAALCKQGAEPCFRQKHHLVPHWSVTISLLASNVTFDFDPRPFAFHCCFNSFS